MVEQLIIMLLFLAMGILFAFGKGSFLIAGYNTMSKEEKAKFDKKKMMKMMSKMMFALAACMAIELAGMITGVKWLIVTGSVLIIPCLIFFLILINRARKK